MVTKFILEKYMKHRWEAGFKVGIKRGLEQSREELQREWESWYERQQAAFREGRPFDEPTPGHSPDTPNLSK